MIGRRALLRSGGLALLATPRRARAQAAGTRRIGFLGGASAAGLRAARGGIRPRPSRPRLRRRQERHDRVPVGRRDSTTASPASRRSWSVRRSTSSSRRGPPRPSPRSGRRRPFPSSWPSSAIPSRAESSRAMRGPAGTSRDRRSSGTSSTRSGWSSLKMAVPVLSERESLINPDNPAMASVLRAMEERAQALKVRLQTLKVAAARRAGRRVPARAEADRGPDRARGRAVPGERRAPVADLATKHRMPTIGFEEYGEAGGLLAYGVDFPHIWRQSAVLVDKIFKGAKPAEPAHPAGHAVPAGGQPQDRQGDRATLPADVLARADRVIGAMTIALLVIDMQVGLFVPDTPRYDADGVVARINTLGGAVREAGGAVVFIQHDGPSGDTFEPGSEGWRLLPSLDRRPGDPVVHKRACDAFYETDLEDTLRARGDDPAARHRLRDGLLRRHDDPGRGQPGLRGGGGGGRPHHGRPAARGRAIRDATPQLGLAEPHSPADADPGHARPRRGCADTAGLASRVPRHVMIYSQPALRKR